MAADQKTEGQYTGILLLGVVMLALMMVPYFHYINSLPAFIEKLAVVEKLSSYPMIYLTRVLYIVLSILFSFILLNPKLSKKIKKEEQPKYRRYFFLLSIPILLGPIMHPIFHYYNIVCFPLLIISHIFCGVRGFSKLGDQNAESDPFAITSKKELKEMGLIYKTDKGPLHVHNVFQGMYVSGGAGAGKSASIIEPAIYQWSLDNASMAIYDFKGNPPTLGLMAYNSWLLPNKSKKIKPTFHVLSFNDDYIDISARPNIFDPKQLNSVIDTMSVLQTFLNGLNPDWRQKKDFWGQSATSLALGIVERLRRTEELHPLCTLPHFLVLATSDPIKLLSWIREDQDVVNMIQTLLTNLDGDVMQTLSNQISSLQAPLVPMFSNELFWVFGAEPENQTSIDINNKENPMILSVSNDPPRKEGLSPGIASLFKAIQRVINQQGKHPSAYIIDELPSLFLDGLAELPATARSNKVCTLLGVQDESQLDVQYGKSAREIIANMGNQFIGMTSNSEVAKKYSDFFGTYEVSRSSTSLSDTSISISDSLKDKKLLQEKDIASQPVGHFIGKIADGAPAMFSVQTNEFKKEDYFPNWQSTIKLDPSNEYLKECKEISSPKEYKTLMKELIEFNYLRIKMEVTQLLNNY